MKQSVMIEAALRHYRPDQVQGESLQILGPGDEFLQELVDRFLEMQSNSNPALIACFYETKSCNVGAVVGGQARMVRQHSSPNNPAAANFSVRNLL